VSFFLVVTIFIVAIVLGLQTARRKTPTSITMAMGASAVIFVILGVLAVGNDPRYEGFAESVAIGWDTENHRNWLHGFQTRDWPLRANGEKVDESTYTRVAWAKEGVKLVVDHPWGTEISKYTFSRLISEKYGVDFVSHSHIGLIDFGLNVGFPGIMLWLVFLIALAWMGWSVTRRYEDAVGLCLFFIVAAFSARMMIDSILRDHMLEQFMFCAGMLMVACAASSQRKESLVVK
jgi:O-antigen ligase